MLNRLRLGFRSIVLRRRMEREMQEEMAEHLERSTARLVARGMSAADARRAAVREFGNVPWLQEQARDARGARWVDALAGDLRFALRHFARKPLTTATMFVVLAVGMSLSTLLFSFVHSYATNPPPAVPLQDDVVRIRGIQDAGIYGRGVRTFSEEELRSYQQLTQHFDAVAGWTFSQVALDAGADPERRGLEARVTFVTDNYFPVLGVQPLLGRGLPAVQAGDPATAASAVINHAAWDQLYGRDPAVIGSTVDVNGMPLTIVGVAPERFGGVGGFVRFQLWVPLSVRSQLVVGPPPQFRAVARLRPGTGAEAASAAVQVIAANHAALAPDPVSGVVRTARDPSADVVPLLSANGDPMFDRDVRLMSFAVGLLALLVLLVTCTNVSALLTGLATARRQEIAIRLSLGAARTRLIRQLLTESALLACAAGAAALGIVGLVLAFVDGAIPQLPLEIRVTPQATAFTFGIALAVGVMFGLSPALHATRLAIAGVLRDSTATLAGSRARLQRGLVVAQIAFTQPLIVLLAAALLLIFGQFQPLARSQFAERLVRVSVGSPGTEASNRQLSLATHEVLQRLRNTAGVEGVTMGWGTVPQLGTFTAEPVHHAADPARDGSDAATAARAVTMVRLSGQRAGADYFDVLGIPLLRGRDFVQSDPGSVQPGAGDVPVIIGADLARRLWSGADPVGRRLQPATDSAVASGFVVVGVVDDPSAATRRAGEGYRVFLPPDTTETSRTLLVRTAGAAHLLTPTIRNIVLEEAPGTPVGMRTLADIEDEQTRNFRIMAGGVTTAGLMALFLSAIGLYAVVAFAVGQRTREIAVRLAVGGHRRQIVRRFLRDGLGLSALGMAIGLPLSLFGLRTLLAIADLPPVPLPAVTSIAAAGVVLVATAAAWLPARRAASVDPAITLRNE